MPLVGQQDVSQTPPPPTPHPNTLSISLRSCPNDDPRPAFNHYLRCPFNNYSTPLHNFNCRSVRWIPVIGNCLIDTIFWGPRHYVHRKLWCIQRNRRGKSAFSSMYYLCCIMQGELTSAASAPKFDWSEVQALHTSLLFKKKKKNVTHSHS